MKPLYTLEAKQLTSKESLVSSLMKENYIISVEEAYSGWKIHIYGKQSNLRDGCITSTTIHTNVNVNPFSDTTKADIINKINNSTERCYI